MFIPVILGTTRKGRYSEYVASFVLEQMRLRRDVETELIDIRELRLAPDDAGEALKEPGFSATMMRADALVLVVPEYNHGYPGLLKHLLDTNLKEYIHKAVGICGVSAGGFGGARVIENLLPVMRELGLVTIFWDGNFSNVQNLFDQQGKIIDPSYASPIGNFLSELIWMGKVLKHGRENVPVGVKQMICPKCGTEMNHHADKIDYASEDESVDTVFGGVLNEIHTCPKCGHIETRVPGD